MLVKSNVILNLQLSSFYHEAAKDKSQSPMSWWSKEFENKLANYSDISCQTFNEDNNSPFVVISGPHGTDLINLLDCVREDFCHIIEIENGTAGGAR